jgi:hypothetical protein
MCGCGVGGGGVLNCSVYHIQQEFYTLFLTRFRTYKIASPPQTKINSKDYIKGLVSLSSFVHGSPCPSKQLPKVYFQTQLNRVNKLYKVKIYSRMKSLSR